MNRSDAGRKGAAARHSIPPEQEKLIAQKAAKTRIERYGEDVFKKMGSKGGKSSGSRHTSDDDE